MKIKLVECPRDAMQGLKTNVPTELKIEYINALLQVGFDVIDFGSFVSPKAIPQMADTREVVKALDLSGSKSDLLAIIANLRGAEQALEHDKINFLGFPFSVSETFQKRNANSTISEAATIVKSIQELCRSNKKELVVYISMAFGNPYNDEYDETIVSTWIGKLSGYGVRIFSLADTVGLATPEQVKRLTASVLKSFPDHEIGVHLHARPEQRKQKIEAAFEAGARRFDGALKGAGGLWLRAARG